jgi:hypothetical protein
VDTARSGFLVRDRDVLVSLEEDALLQVAEMDSLSATMVSGIIVQVWV